MAATNARFGHASGMPLPAEDSQPSTPFTLPTYCHLLVLQSARIKDSKSSVDLLSESVTANGHVGGFCLVENLHPRRSQDAYTCRRRFNLATDERGCDEGCTVMEYS